MKNKTAAPSYGKPIHLNQTKLGHNQETKHTQSTALAMLGGPGDLQFTCYICPWQTDM